MGRFILLAGPSCVGKGPLHHALQKLYPELARTLHPVVLYNSRAPRPGERDGVDYHFRPRTEIENLTDDPGFIVADVRGDLQAIEISSIQEILATEQDAFFEGNPFIPAKLRACQILEHLPTLSAFLSPFSREELLFFQEPAQKIDLETFVADVMRRKLLRRTKRQKTHLSLKDLENIENRAESAFTELREAWKFDVIIPNHDGEDSEHWDAFYYPIGDARKALLTFVDLLRGEPSAWGEQWEKDLLPS
ncbi:hypothetical protein GF339_06100 [candidate division KSB3 bacterium]|uniref:Guanylate kinase-like domain-containing protein n=1 Tax=candidate division KSB3 bacterium TaxID=2044937 RepID=A0A9D5Q5R5_9BACT|nr:hypothetical protein [candidate division KSB3 bacterium]MBD3324136.1 hypothetical protein [candidate division KSB3 bacterium]